MNSLAIFFLGFTAVLFATSIAAFFRPSAFLKISTPIYKKPVGRVKTALIPFAWACMTFVFCLISITSKSTNPSATVTAEDQHAEPLQPSSKVVIHPEDIVAFPKSAIICATQNFFNEAMAHSARGERTKFDAMFKKDDGLGGPKCIVSKPGFKFKVLAVEPGPAWDFIEIVPATSPDAEGIWTATVGASVEK
ncbi:hypothetical protein [Herbaspirillum huttiense]|uniref:hypothetical protein n=1 Tax=Herbaspirillum huttiense TaxID=863372 RepID=UPI002E7802E9|nr:hypothetical protein [Herbaspirillum huttiense]MEE1636325.1 hypothetical protein [Herbaspirillum huttiense NC40101]